MTASEPTRKYSQLSAICAGYGSTILSIETVGIEHWNQLSESGAKPISDKIDKLLAADDTFEDGELRPSEDAVRTIKKLLHNAETCGTGIPSAEPSVFWGEIAVTWQIDERYLRLVAYSDDRSPLLYFDESSANTPSRGEAIRPATVKILTEKLGWLVGVEQEAYANAG